MELHWAWRGWSWLGSECPTEFDYLGIKFARCAAAGWLATVRDSDRRPGVASVGV